jgi:Zn-dependent protease/CBS domain-containing protein
LLVLPVFAWVIGSQIDQWVTILGQLSGGAFVGDGLSASPMRWVLGASAALGLFAGVLLHELGHSLVAMGYGYEIESIKLWILGGVAQFTEIPEDWRQELTVAIAGPITSIALGGLSYVAFLAIPTEFPAVRFVVGYLAVMNVALAAFNMLPGFPMDGGRVLRALLARSRSRVQATQIAAEVGKLFAFLLGLFGILSFNLIMIAIAFFIYIGAAGEAQQTVLKSTFEDVTVADLMTPKEELHTVTPETSIAELLERMLRQRHVGYPVVENGRLVGMVTLDDTQSTSAVEHDAIQVRDVMSKSLTTISPNEGIVDAMQKMQQSDVGRIPVVEDGDLVGLISRTDLVRALQIRQAGGLLNARRENELPTVRP